MTLTELRYVVAVARERHFGRAAESCQVSQPTLSVAVRKFEDELGVQLFERGSNEVAVTPVGARVIEQAQRVLEEAQALREIAEGGRDPLDGPLRIGVLPTVAPGLLPALVRRLVADAPRMPPVLHEDVGARLLEALRQGDIDVAIVAGAPSAPGMVTQPVHDEPFVVAVPAAHPWAQRASVAAAELAGQTVLLPAPGHCLRDQVLALCPDAVPYALGEDGARRIYEAPSLEALRLMVGAGLGIAVLPAGATPAARERPESLAEACAAVAAADDLVAWIPFEPSGPSRRVTLAWRRSFSRGAAVEALRRALLAASLPGLVRLPDAPASSA